MRTRTNDRLNAANGEANDTGPERTCVLTRATGPKDRLIRLALGPDGQVAPDVRARAPGRGAWIGVGRKALDEANAKGKLKGALARAFKTGDLDVPADLGERIEATLRAQALDRLGLEARGGTLVTGAERVEAAARAGQGSPAHPRRRRRRGRPQEARPGLARWRRRPGGVGISRGAHHLVDGAGPRKCGTHRLDRCRSRKARHSSHRPVASFH